MSAKDYFLRQNRKDSREDVARAAVLDSWRPLKKTKNVVDRVLSFEWGGCFVAEDTHKITKSLLGLHGL